DVGDDLASARQVVMPAGQQTEIAENLGNNPSGNNDIDLYKVDLLAGDILQANIDAYSLGLPGNLDSVLRVFDRNGLQLAVNDVGIDPVTGVYSTLDAALEFTAVSTGTYYIGVSSYANFNYDPRISPQTGPDPGGHSTGDYHLLLGVTHSVVTADAGD